MLILEIEAGMPGIRMNCTDTNACICFRVERKAVGAVIFFIAADGSRPEPDWEG